ncbi:MAG: PRC-barrel domain-containing protein [Kiritimatiellae bacterium]|nr:PRC-barrel domain-containing protein [Kiritimatiellia bacterium]
MNPTGDPTLRSMQKVRGYHIQGSDGEIGHVDDFIIDDETWAIRYLVVDTKNWWREKKVLVSPQWIERVSWDEAEAMTSVA